jgi:hypothetical protein
MQPLVLTQMYVRHIALAASQFNCSTLSGLEACAEPLCFDVFELQRLDNGTVRCVRVRQQATTISPIVAAALLLPYDYDYLFRFGADVEPLGTSVSSLVGGRHLASPAAARQRLDAAI